MFEPTNLSQSMQMLLLLLVLAELFEAYIQYAPNLMGVLEKLHGYYQRSVFYFFLIHPSFYILLFMVVLTDRLNLTFIFALALKIFDIFSKLELIKKVYVQKEVNTQMQAVLLQPIPSWFFLLGVVTYPFLAYVAIS